MKQILKTLVGAVLGDYQIYRVGRVQGNRPLQLMSGHRLGMVSIEELRCASEPVLRDSAWYLGSEAMCVGIYEGGRLLAIACCWWGGRYEARNSWPIEKTAAKLVFIVTVPEARGRGLAPVLIQFARQSLQEQGRAPLYARIWHNNAPSMRAFERAGWAPVGMQLFLNPLRLRRPWQLRWRT